MGRLQFTMYSLSSEHVENESTRKNGGKKDACTQTIITANDLKSIESSQSKMRAEDYINTFYSSKNENTSKKQAAKPRGKSQDFESFLTLFANFYNKSEKDAKELWDSLSLAEKKEYFEKIYAIKKGK